MLKAIVNEAKSFEVHEVENVVSLNKKELDWDIISNGEQFHILYNHKSYKAELISKDFVSKKIKLKINGKNYSVDIKDKLDLLLEKLGMSQLASTALKEIKAPMPGLILEISAQEGMELKKGDPVMILEAMKMENILKSPGEGIVEKISVKKGESVEKNQVLIKFID